VSNVIIGIHGLANKPDRRLLSQGWDAAIKEGLRRNCGIANPRFRFEMVYWADLLYYYTLHRDDAFDFDDLYDSQPYVPADGDGALPEYERGWFEDIRNQVREWADNGISALNDVLGDIADTVRNKVARDLTYYYDPNRRIRDRNGRMRVARQVLMADLMGRIKAQRGNRVMVIAHSMGSIIAYDVLRDLGRQSRPMPISTLLTIGSPLGFSYVKANLIEYRDYDARLRNRVRTPSVVSEKWLNFLDRRDPVALDSRLYDDYAENRSGIRVEDVSVLNGYLNPIGGKNNYHKSYGYLRAPEVSRAIEAFISSS
jgi:hypothetical protein